MFHLNTGEMSFDEYSALLEEQVKQEPVDTEGFMGIAQLESTTSGSHREPLKYEMSYSVANVEERCHSKT